MKAAGLGGSGGRVRYDLRRAHWDIGLGTAIFLGGTIVIIAELGASAELIIWFGWLAAAIGLSELGSRALNYVILHDHHLDIRKKPWFAKTRGEKWRIPYKDILSADIANKAKAEITITFLVPQKAGTGDVRLVTFRVRSSARAVAVEEAVTTRVESAKQLHGIPA